MGIRAPGSTKTGAKADVTTNKLGQKTSSNSTQPAIGERQLQAQSVRLLSAMSEPLLSHSKPATHGSWRDVSRDVPPRPSHSTASQSQPRYCSGCGVQGTDVSECLACAMATVHPITNNVVEEKVQDKNDSVKLSRGKRRRLRRALPIGDQSFSAMD